MATVNSVTVEVYKNDLPWFNCADHLTHTFCLYQVDYPWAEIQLAYKGGGIYASPSNVEIDTGWYDVFCGDPVEGIYELEFMDRFNISSENTNYIANCYTLNFVSSYADNGTVPEQTIHGSNSYFVVPDAGDLTKEGCIFKGWNTAEDGTGKYYTSGESIGGLRKQTTLYAIWEKVVKKYIFDGVEYSVFLFTFFYDQLTAPDPRSAVRSRCQLFLA